VSIRWLKTFFTENAFFPYFYWKIVKISAKKAGMEPLFRLIFPSINGTPNDIRAALADACRTLESAADFTRGGGAPTPSHDADHASRSKRVETEQRRLIQWAKENGKLSRSRRLPPVFARGGEHNVFFQKHTQRYLKATRLDRQRGYGIALGSFTHGATPSEYLDHRSPKSDFQ
jgi:hypothetical protein